MKKYIRVNIYKHCGDASGLISSCRNWAYLFAEGISKDEIKQICDKNKIVYEDVLQVKTCRLSSGMFKHAKPVAYNGSTSFGGTFVYLSDACFGEITGTNTFGFALPLCDFVDDINDILD